MWPFNKLKERMIRNAFKDYLNKDTLDKIIKNPSKLKLEADKREVTVSFTNMIGYVGIAEKMSLSVLPEFMNKFLKPNL